MSDPLRAAADRLCEIAIPIADLEEKLEEIRSKLSTAYDVGVAHGFDRAGLRAAARALRSNAGRSEADATRELYVAAVLMPKE